MKLKKIAAVLTGIVTVISSACIFTACADDENNGGYVPFGETRALDIDNYASYLNGDNAVYRNGVTSAVKLNLGGEKRCDAYSENFMCFVANGKYRVVSTRTGITVASDILTQPQFYTLENKYPYIKIEDASSRTKFIGEDGTVLLDTDRRYSVELVSAYVNNKRSPRQLIRFLTFVPGDFSSNTYDYFEAKEDEATGIYRYTHIDSSTVSETAGDFDAGTYSFDYIYGEYGNVKNGIAQYQYNIANSKISFYKTGEKTGELDFSDCNLLGFVGEYMYYNRLSPRAPDSGDYNCFLGGEKYKYEFFRYAVASDQAVSLNYDRLVYSINPAYNKVTETIDAAYVCTVPMYDGKYCISRTGECDCYLTDSELNIGYTFAGGEVGYNEVDGIVKLNDNGYLVNRNGATDESMSYFVDSAGNFLGEYDGNAAIPLYQTASAGLVAFEVDNRIGFKDFTGKVIYAAEYEKSEYVYNSSLNKFFGGKAVACKQTDNYELLFLDGTGTQTLLSQDENTEIYIYDGFYRQKIARADGKYDIAFFSYNGSSLVEFNGLNSDPFNMYVNDNILSYIANSNESHFYKFD